MCEYSVCLELKRIEFSKKTYEKAILKGLCFEGINFKINDNIITNTMLMYSKNEVCFRYII